MAKRPHDAALCWDLVHAPAPGTPSGGAADKPAYTRAKDTCEPLYKPWVLRKADYDTQYAPMYYSRLQTIRAWLVSRLRAEAQVPVRSKLIDVVLKEECWIVGTLFKTMPLRPSALDDYAEDRNTAPRVQLDCYVSDGDTLALEDETGRAQLVGAALDVPHLVTGLVVALRGAETDSGDFCVVQLVLPDMAPQPTRAPAASGMQYVALVSGLHVGTAAPLPAALLADWLSGQLGAPQEQALAARVSRLIVCGNSLSAPAGGSDGGPGGAGTEPALKHHHQHMSAAAQLAMVAPLQTLDTLLAQLASALPVQLMPGPDDPANCCLPQQPFNVALFPLCSRYSAFAATTNPYRATVNGALLLGHSGQPVDDVRRCTAADGSHSALDVACAALRWRHLCPTAPDTLPCYPYRADDPFVIDTTPHLLFVGNQAAYGTRVERGPEGQAVRVVLVPSFAATGTLVLVDTATMEPRTITFGARRTN